MAFAHVSSRLLSRGCGTFRLLRHRLGILFGGLRGCRTDKTKQAQQAEIVPVTIYFYNFSW